MSCSQLAGKPNKSLAFFNTCGKKPRSYVFSLRHTFFRLFSSRDVFCTALWAAGRLDLIVAKLLSFVKAFTRLFCYFFVPAIIFSNNVASLDVYVMVMASFYFRSSFSL